MTQRPLEASTGPSRVHLDPDSTLGPSPPANTLAGHMVWGANVSCPKCGAGMPAEIRANGGLIEKYIGDAVVAVFGAVDEDEGHPEQAQHAALAILGALERTNARIEGRTGRRLALRVGVNTGIAVAGAIGDKE